MGSVNWQSAVRTYRCTCSILDYSSYFSASPLDPEQCTLRDRWQRGRGRSGAICMVNGTSLKIIPSADTSCSCDSRLNRGHHCNSTAWPLLPMGFTLLAGPTNSFTCQECPSLTAATLADRICTHHLLLPFLWLCCHTLPRRSSCASHWGSPGCT